MDIKNQLYEKAATARKNAYAPYSGYKVGAAVLTVEEKVYASCNVENVSFPCGTCAEAGAIAAMSADGGKKIKAILITADGKELVRPCGACLQRIAEFADEDIIIYLADENGVKVEYRLHELLPHVFNATLTR